MFVLNLDENKGFKLFNGEVDSTEDAIINLEKCLMVQKRIFEVA